MMHCNLNYLNISASSKDVRILNLPRSEFDNVGFKWGNSGGNVAVSLFLNCYIWFGSNNELDQEGVDI